MFVKLIMFSVLRIKVEVSFNYFYLFYGDSKNNYTNI